MDAPKCRICEKRHWGLCETFDPIKEDVAELLVASNTASNVPDASNGSASNRKQRWDRSAYNAYQREYMRRKREHK